MQAAFVTLSKPLTHTDKTPLVCKRRPSLGYPSLFRTITSCDKAHKSASNAPSPEDDGSTNDTRRRRMPMPPETRKKISDALKGRRKSAEHRESLRRRFEGAQNPMYGRKRSPESRAKISRAMSAKAKQKKSEKPEKPPVQEAALDHLRQKAVDSKLITSVTQQTEKRQRHRRVHDEIESTHVDRLLERVARLEQPPEAVVRTLNKNREKRQKQASEKRNAPHSQQPPSDKQTSEVVSVLPEARNPTKSSRTNKKAHATCSVCNGTGLIQCPKCVASGVPSSRCELCFGAGGMFCDACNGVGALMG